MPSEPEPLPKEFLLQRGCCCGNQCQNCPYAPKWEKGSVEIRQENPVQRFITLLFKN